MICLDYNALKINSAQIANGKNFEDRLYVPIVIGEFLRVCKSYLDVRPLSTTVKCLMRPTGFAPKPPSHQPASPEAHRNGSP